jgi:murein DD-endopeptidase MepM/ murein hydrolase activator NlpD
MISYKSFLFSAKPKAPMDYPRSLNGVAGWSLLFLCFFTCLTPVSAEFSKEDQLETINKKISENKDKIKEKKEIKAQEERQLSIIKRELRFTELSLRKTRQNLRYTQSREKETRDLLEKTEADFSQLQSTFTKRIRGIYQHQQLGPLDFIFAPAQETSIVESMYYFDQILAKDVTLLDALRKKQAQLTKERLRLKKQIQNIAALKEDVASKEKLLSSKSKEQLAVVSTLQSQIKKMEKQNSALEQSSRQISTALRSMGSHGTGYYGLGFFVKPTTGWISSQFGSRRHPIFKRRINHNGTDFAAPSGTRIVAGDSGYIVVAGEKSQYRGYGKITIIDHGTNKNGVRVSSVYAHQSRILVREGEFVQQGQEIGWVGSTGYSTGPHLHFEVRHDGTPVDPMKYIK